MGDSALAEVGVSALIGRVGQWQARCRSLPHSCPLPTRGRGTLVSYHQRQRLSRIARQHSMTKVNISKADPYPLLTARAKAMRARMTPAEARLWKALRQRQPMEGTHFRRQVRLECYIVDFCCLGAKLVVEVDGNQHGFDGRREADAQRTRALEAKGFRVMRFSNADVLREIDSVVETIRAAVSTPEVECTAAPICGPAP